MDNPIKKYMDKRAAEKEHYRKHNPKNKPTRLQTIVKVVVGAYLYYIIYSMIKEGALGETGIKKILIIAALIAFAVFGIIFIVVGVKGLMDGDFYDPYETEEELEERLAEEEGRAVEHKEEIEEAEEKVEEGPKSLSELAKLSERAQVPEDEQ